VSGAPSGDQSSAELKTARTLNTVATIGAGHAIYGSLPGGVKRQVGVLVPRKAKAVARLAQTKVAIPKGAGKKAAIAASAGWLGFHGAELAGDVMSRRSINAQLKQKENAVAKSTEQSVFSKSDEVRVTGRGVNLSKALPGANVLSSAKVAGNVRNAVWHENQRGFHAGRAAEHWNKSHELRRANQAGWLGEQTRAVEAMDRAGKQSLKSDASEYQARMEARKLRNRALGVGAAAGVGVTAAGAVGVNEAKYRRSKKSVERILADRGRVEKRNFDAEADRQRRLGLYAGAGLGAGVVAGDAARRRFETVPVKVAGGGESRMLRIRPGRYGKSKAAALAAVSALAAGGGLAAYKRGVSEKNRPWM